MANFGGFGMGSPYGPQALANMAQANMAQQQAQAMAAQGYLPQGWMPMQPSTTHDFAPTPQPPPAPALPAEQAAQLAEILEFQKSMKKSQEAAAATEKDKDKEKEAATPNKEAAGEASSGSDGSKGQYTPGKLRYIEMVRGMGLPREEGVFEEFEVWERNQKSRLVGQFVDEKEQQAEAKRQKEEDKLEQARKKALAAAVPATATPQGTGNWGGLLAAFKEVQAGADPAAAMAKIQQPPLQPAPTDPSALAQQQIAIAQQQQMAIAQQHQAMLLAQAQKPQAFDRKAQLSGKACEAAKKAFKTKLNPGSFEEVLEQLVDKKLELATIRKAAKSLKLEMDIPTRATPTHRRSQLDMILQELCK